MLSPAYADQDGTINSGDYNANYTVRDALDTFNNYLQMKIFSSNEASIKVCEQYSYELYIDGLDSH